MVLTIKHGVSYGSARGDDRRLIVGLILVAVRIAVLDVHEIAHQLRIAPALHVTPVVLVEVVKCIVKIYVAL